MKKLVIGFIVLAVLLAFSSIAIANVKDIANRSMYATVTIVVENSALELVGMGTGFFIDHDRIITCYHVVESIIPSKTFGYVLLYHSTTKHPLTILKINPSLDAALVTIGFTPNFTHKVKSSFGRTKFITESPIFSPALKQSDLYVGMLVYAIGNPFGLESSFSIGNISGFRTIDDKQFLQFTAPISPGNSGGPLITESGTVIGIVAMTMERGQNINFAIPLYTLKDFLK